MSKSYIRWAGDLIIRAVGRGRRGGGHHKGKRRVYEARLSDYHVGFWKSRSLHTPGLFETIGLVGEGGRDVATPGSRVGSSLPADGSLHAIHTDVYGRQALSVEPNTSSMEPVGARFTATQKKSVG